MSIKVFTGPGALAKIQGKKPILSNKALTRQVRALHGKEGQRTMLVQNLINNVTLVANTAQIFYLTTINGAEDTIIHSLRFYIRWQSVINSANRLIIFEDVRAAQGNAAAALVLATVGDVFSAYVGTVHPFSAKRLNKNLGLEPRIRILRDTMFADNEVVADVDNIKTIKFDMNFRGRKTIDHTYQSHIPNQLILY